MRITDNLSETLPTGRWLAKQRVGLLQTIGQVAKALKRHPSTIRAVERNNRVIPPGWSEGLRKLGMQLPAPAWPAEMPFYFGEDLRRDMNTCIGLRDSRYWLSKQLCVPEEAVAAILRGNHVVPHNWLLKLAELGANVPAVVRTALYPPVVDVESRAAEPAPRDFSELFSNLEEGGFGQGPRAAGSAAGAPQGAPHYPHESVGHDSDSDVRPPAEASSERRKPQSISFQWSREEGLQFNLSTPLLEQVAAGLKELLLIYQNSLIETTQHPAGLRTAEPSRG